MSAIFFLSVCVLGLFQMCSDFKRPSACSTSEDSSSDTSQQTSCPKVQQIDSSTTTISEDDQLLSLQWLKGELHSNYRVYVTGFKGIVELLIFSVHGFDLKQGGGFIVLREFCA